MLSILCNFKLLSKQYKEPEFFFLSKLSIVPNHKRPTESVFPSFILLLINLGSIFVEKIQMENKKKKILGIIQPIFQEVLKNKKLKLKYESSPETIKNWDSTSTVAIVVDLEKSLKINEKHSIFPGWRIEMGQSLTRPGYIVPCKPSTRAMSRCWATTRASRYIQPVRRTAPEVIQIYFWCYYMQNSCFLWKSWYFEVSDTFGLIKEKNAYVKPWFWWYEQ